jgi:hypothetical protein
MTQDEIIEMAKQAGFWKEHTNTWMCNSQDIEAFANLVAQHEREACAKVCDDIWKDNYTAYACAEAIRARGQA